MVVHTNDSVSIALETVNHDLLQFKPLYTYVFFGEKQFIDGIDAFQVNLKYVNGSLMALVETDNPDLARPLIEKLDKESITFDKQLYDSWLKKEFKPLGKLVAEFTIGNERFELYSGTWNVVGMREYHRRMQIFSLFLIEGASYIDENDNNWEIFCLYKKSAKDELQEYCFVGYVTCYHFFMFPDKIRERISQFLILPPFFGKGIGSKLLECIYSEFQTRPEVGEITVEDPNEFYDRMRCTLECKLVKDLNMHSITEIQKKLKLPKARIKLALAG